MADKLTDYIAQFARALEDEIAAEKADERSSRYLLTDGMLVSGSSDERYFYLFRTPYELTLPDEAAVQLEVAEHRVNGVYAGGDRDLVTIAAEEFLGARVPSAMMIATPWDLLMKLEERLDELGEAEEQGRALALLEPAAATGSLPELQEALAKPLDLDVSQQAALQKVAACDVSFLWGPPGTGKTRTVACLVRALLECQKSVLLLAHSNAAVDVATLAVARACRGTPLLAGGALIRYGLMTNKDLLAEPDINPLEILARRNADAERFVGLQSRRRDLLEHARREELFDTEAFDSVRKDMGDLRHRVDRELKKLVAQTPAVATTLTKLALSDELIDRMFDAVIIDEASMSLVPYDVLAAARSRGKVVLAGDFMQLPPIAAGQTLAVQQWLQRDIYQVRGIPRAVREEKELPEMAMLRRQYRMHPTIRSTISGLFYHGQLEEGERVVVRTSSIARLHPFAGQALAAVDLSLLAPRCYRELRGYSRLNLIEAVTICSLAAGMLDRSPDLTVGVITPYAVQARLLTTMARELELDRGRLTISTVHRYQGSEVDVVLFSLVDSEPQWSLSTLTRGDLADWDCDPAPRLLNVALSRARGKFILVGNLDFVRDRGSRDAVLRHIVQQIEQEGTVCRVDPHALGPLRDWLPNHTIAEQRIVVGERARHQGWLLGEAGKASGSVFAGSPTLQRLPPITERLLQSIPADCRMHYADRSAPSASLRRFSASIPFSPAVDPSEGFLFLGGRQLILDGTLERGVRPVYVALDLPQTSWFFLKNTGFVPETLLGRNPGEQRRRRWYDRVSERDRAAAPPCGAPAKGELPADGSTIQQLTDGHPPAH